MTEADLFADALELADSAEQAAFLDQACGDDIELRRRVERLLQLHESDRDFLEPSPPSSTLDQTAEFDVFASDTEPEPTPRIGTSAPITRKLMPDGSPPQSQAPAALANYDIDQTLGRGGMGVVLKARDRKLKRDVAIKVLAPQLAAHPESVQRFLREAQSAAAVRHENVVTIYSVDDNSQTPFIVMEYIAGESLDERIKREGPLPACDVAEIGRQIALGLAAAHAKGLVHRDIKPGNVLLEKVESRETRAESLLPLGEGGRRPDEGAGHAANSRTASTTFRLPHPGPLPEGEGEGALPARLHVKLTDFGLARAVDDISLTQSGMIAGTPQFMSPEQADGRTVDHRTDLFSLGSVLYTMCVGRPPFEAHNTVATLRRIVDAEPQPIAEQPQPLPDWLWRIIHKLLSKKPEDRFQTAHEVAELLTRHLVTWNESTLVRSSAANPSDRKPSRRQVIAMLLFVATIVGVTASFQAKPKGPMSDESGINSAPRDNNVTAVGSSSTDKAVADLPLNNKRPVPDPFISDQYHWSEPVNLGSGVNSPESEECPCISSDGLTLIFNRVEQGRTRLWESRREVVSKSFGSAVLLPSEINPPDTDNDCPFLSRDGLTLWFASSRSGGRGTRDLWISHRKSTSDTWEKPKNLGPNVNTEEFEQTPFVTDDGLTLLFSRRVTGYFRICQATRTNENESFGDATVLTNNINAGVCASFPRLTADGLSMVFNHCQARENNLGLWLATRQSVDEEFSVPTDLGPIINDSVVTGPALSNDGLTLYYASQRGTSNDKYDLWSITRVPKPVAER